jgi:hypothetical protein
LQDDDTCALCSQVLETSAHLLLEFVYSWFLVLRWLVMLHALPPADVVDVVDWWLPACKGFVACSLVGFSGCNGTRESSMARLTFGRESFSAGGGSGLVVGRLPCAH